VDAYLLTHVLRGPVRNPYGTAYAAAALKRPLAGKTGSTNENRDAWFVGYSPALAAGVWVGRDLMEPLGRSATGARAALPIWIDFMEQALASETRDADANDSFAIPDGVEWTWRDPETGALQRSPRAIAGFVPSAAGRPVRRSKVVAVPKPPKPPEPPPSPAAVAAAAQGAVPYAPVQPSGGSDWLPPIGAAPPLAP
jgi:penicillin-binding protein 1A